MRHRRISYCKTVNTVIRKRPAYRAAFQCGVNIKIDTTGRHITGHSGRATMCSKLFNEGFQESTVKERSGHRSKAVQSYMRAYENMKRGINNVLQAKLPSLLYTDAMPPLRRTQGN